MTQAPYTFRSQAAGIRIGARVDLLDDGRHRVVDHETGRHLGVFPAHVPMASIAREIIQAKAAANQEARA